MRPVLDRASLWPVVRRLLMLVARATEPSTWPCGTSHLSAQGILYPAFGANRDRIEQVLTPETQTLIDSLEGVVYMIDRNCVIQTVSRVGWFDFAIPVWITQLTTLSISRSRIN